MKQIIRSWIELVGIAKQHSTALDDVQAIKEFLSCGEELVHDLRGCGGIFGLPSEEESEDIQNGLQK